MLQSLLQSLRCSNALLKLLLQHKIWKEFTNAVKQA